MTDLDQIRADLLELHARVERMQQESRRIMAQHAGMPLWMVDYVTESERAWSLVMERCHDLEAQVKRIGDGSTRGSGR